MKKDLADRVDELEEKLSHFSSIETTLNKSILIAQETAEDVKRSADKEAKLIIKEAEKNADRIINESLSKSRKITLEIEELKKQASVYRTRFRMLLEAQLEMLNTDDWDDLSKSNEEEEEESYENVNG